MAIHTDLSPIFAYLSLLRAQAPKNQFEDSPNRLNCSAGYMLLLDGLAGDLVIQVSQLIRNV
jgi:hypothetical protein